MTMYRVRLGLHDTAVRVERHRLTATCIVYSDGPSDRPPPRKECDRRHHDHGGDKCQQHSLRNTS